MCVCVCVCLCVSETKSKTICAHRQDSGKTVFFSGDNHISCCNSVLGNFEAYPDFTFALIVNSFGRPFDKYAALVLTLHLSNLWQYQLESQFQLSRNILHPDSLTRGGV